MNRIRALRAANGWSQADLAERAGVTRQLVAAVEAGRHAPNVHAALGLARALGVSVEHLFAHEAVTSVDPVLGEPAPVGTPITTATVGRRLVGVPLVHAVAPTESWALADAVATGSDVDWLPDANTDGLVIAGCDPLLGMLSALAMRRSHDRVVAVHASTGRAIEALAAGRVHGVVVHGPLRSLPTPPVPVERWRVARWQVGLATDGCRPPSIEEVAARRLRVVQREQGAGSQDSFERALRRVGADGPIPGPVAEGHLDVARRVANGAAKAGVTMEAAARAYELRFSPIETHEVELWLEQRWIDLPVARGTVELLTDPAFLRRAANLAGYDLSDCGRASA